MAHDLSHDALGSAPMSMCLSNPNTDAIAQAVNSIGMDPGGLPLETDATGIDSTHPDTYSLEAQQDHDGLEGDVEDDDGCGVASDVPQGLTAVSIPDTMSLQSLLATMQGSGTGQLVNNGNGQIIQIVTLSNPGDLAALTGNNVGAKLVQLVPTTDQQLVSQVDGSLSSGVKSLMSGQAASSDLVTVPSLLSVPQPPPVQSLPPGCPTWAARLRDCEQIGDSYRGWVESEVELDLLLTYHKQQTQSLWGTRQSPSPGKPSTRLMWKSQYVPFDGVPFVNAGSRAIVMECQYGPRRKGGQLKRHQEVLGPRAAEYKQTCPARIYIKKVKKFPEYRVDVTQDKKSLKAAMEKAFMELKQRGTEYPGEERYFVQLPTEKAHEFHIEKPAEELETTPHRLHPKVANKIRDVVSTGETRLYVIRKALRRFVERELFDGPDDIPERHNLAYFPTVHDLQNHIYQAIKDIETGILPLKPHLVNVVAQPDLSNDIQEVDASALWATANEGPHAETVTVTLTQNSSEAEGSHVISKVETHLSDGTTQISSTLNQETAQLLQKLHPQMFPVGTLIQLQNPNSASTIDLSGAQAHLVSVPASGDQAVVTMATEGQSSSIISTGTLDVSNVGTHNLISQTSDSAALSRLITQAEAITPLMKLEPSTADCMADSTDLSSAADRLGAEADSSMDTSTGSVGNLVPGTNGHLSAGVEPGEITDMHIPNIDGTSVTGLPVDGTQLVHADTQMAISGDNNMVTLAMSETGDLVKLVNEQAPTEGTEDDTQHMQ